MSTVALSETNFAETVQANEIVLIDFWASWCGPCRSFAPVFEKVSGEFDEVVFAKVDTEDQQELARAFSITSIPTLLAIRQGVVLLNQPGAMAEADLRRLVTGIQSVDMDAVRAELDQAEAEPS